MSASIHHRYVTRNVVKLGVEANSSPGAAGIPPHQASILRQLDDECWLLDNGQTASRAFSCLVQPQAGDTVLYISASTQTYVLAILQRSSTEEQATLSLPAHQNIAWVAQKMRLSAQQHLQLECAGDIDINASFGKLMVTVKDLIQHIQVSFIQRCKQYICRRDMSDIDTRQLAKSHARHQILTADKDVRINADRINMG